MLDLELSKVRTKRKIYDMHLPLSYLEAKALESELLKHEVYCSNHIEGNSFTKNETTDLIDLGITPASKPYKDSVEVVNLYKILSYSYEDVNREITEELILFIHKVLTVGILDFEDCGVYKTRYNRIGDITTSSPEHTPVHMKKLLLWYSKQDKNKQNIIAIATDFKYKFLCIHPFSDGNGRVSRILFNLMLLKYGYIKTFIEPSKRDDYYKALKTCNKTGSTISLYKFMCERLVDSYDYAISILEK